MTLSEYLTTKNLSPGEFAKRLKCAEPTVNRYITGARIPEKQMMVRIVRATDGDVTPNDFYGVQPERV
jgi:DNA-binding transcriptional regulator YdaS (Cro superfamily)